RSLPVAPPTAAGSSGSVAARVTPSSREPLGGSHRSVHLRPTLEPFRPRLGARLPQHFLLLGPPVPRALLTPIRAVSYLILSHDPLTHSPRPSSRRFLSTFSFLGRRFTARGSHRSGR